MIDDRTPPQNNAAEQAVLGSLLSGSRAIDDVADVLAGSDFYRPAHEEIYDAILAVHRRRERVDTIMVGRQLGSEVGKVGGLEYLAALISADVAPHPAQAVHYARLVLDAAIGRRVVEVGTRITQLGYTADDKREAVEEARRMVDEAAGHGSAEDAGIGAGDLLTETLDSLESEADPGLATGWSDVDDVANGLRSGQLVIVGARPSVGKSVVAANIAANVCKDGVGVHFASLEMSRAEVMNRLLSAHATVGLDRLMSHKLTEDDWNRLARRGSEVREWPLWIDDTPSQTLLQLRARARTTSRRMPLGLIVVDYLQLMSPRDRRVPREQQVGELSEGLKALSKELAVPVVALAQVNRGSAERHDKRPLLSDLRESGRIEADADHVWLLHRQDMVDPKSATGELELIFAKNRNGPSGRTVTLSFQGHFSRAVQQAWAPTRSLQ